MKPARDPNRPKVPDVVPLIQALYARPLGGAGCCLHVVTDDGNYEDSAVDFCIGYAVERGHKDCEEVARLLRQMTWSQRKRASRQTQTPLGVVPVTREGL